MEDPELSRLVKADMEEDEYQKVMQALKEWLVLKNLSSHPALQFSSVWNDLSLEGNLIILDSTRIVVPEASRKEILEILQIPHRGIAKTRSTP